jgi:hypothetical protein
MARRRADLYRRNAAASHRKRPLPRENTPQHRAAWASNSRPVERLLRETGHADAWSAAIDDHGSNRAPYSKVFLCLLSLHQQRKKVGCGDEIPACAPKHATAG